jgi:hypothetical protein
MSIHRTGISNMNPDYSALVRHGLENPSHVIDFANLRARDLDKKKGNT